MTIKILPNDKGNPPGKLADAEVHFTDGPLEGLRLIGFAVWESRGQTPGRDHRGLTNSARTPVVRFSSTPFTAPESGMRACVSRSVTFTTTGTGF